MKRYLTLVLAIVLASSISAMNRIPVEPGVSKALAEFRAAHIINISYALHFDVTPNVGTLNNVLITFDFKKDTKEDLQIDFCGSAHDCIIGKAVAVINDNWKKIYSLQHINEHIIVPNDLLSDGTNTIWISFRGPKLNKREDYLYTLNVPANARKLFPCFDQPDLKAEFELSLTIPEDWKAISAGKQIERKWEETTLGNIVGRKPDRGTKDVFFEKTGHIPTYLFSFVAGKFEEYSDNRDGKEINCLYRETDSAKVAQLPQIMNQVRHSIKWMEDYTGIPFPFPKLDFVILPGYQFGGMEHIGAIQFNDRRMFLEKKPTQDQLLSRAELIAHEVSHMWFGDLVTMKWFDDVWTKEVFANYMASMIVAEQFPDINHNLNFIRNYHISALEEDRTDGTHPIAQRLDNLKDAGLLYGNIIYKKAPIVMRKLHQLMGDEPFRAGLQKYLKKYSYSNATWDDLIDILSDEAPQANLKAFSQSWVKERGCPTITYNLSKRELTINQQDIQGTKAYRKLLADITGEEQKERNIVWPQTVNFLIHYGPYAYLSRDLFENRTVSIYLEKQTQTINYNKYGPPKHGYLIPNYDGSGYGRFCLKEDDRQMISSLDSEESELSSLMTNYESVLTHNLSASNAVKGCLFTIKPHLNNPLVISTAVDYLSSLMNLIEDQREIQEHLWREYCGMRGYTSTKQKIIRLLINKATEKDIVENLYDIWKEQKDTLLNQSDYINLSYQLAIRYPDKWQEIIDTQLSRIENEDKRKEFEFVSRACNPDPKKQDELFAELLEPENRKIEPWALSALSLLNHPLREEHGYNNTENASSNRFIRPALDELLEVQQTGDIFFPKNWCTTLLSGHRSPEARQILLDFLEEQLILQKQAGQNKEASESGESKAPIPQPLLNKLLMAGYVLLNAE